MKLKGGKDFMFSYKGLTMENLKVERNNLRRIMYDLSRYPSDYFYGRGVQVFINLYCIWCKV